MIKQINSLLRSNGFTVVDFSDSKVGINFYNGKDGTSNLVEVKLKTNSLDVIAKKEYLTLLVKHVAKTDNFSKQKCYELITVARFLKGSPLIIGEENRNGLLEDNVLYNRYGINMVSISTFKAILSSGEYPRLVSQRGGLFVEVDGEKLKELRQEHNFSLKDMERYLDLSSKAIYDYEMNKIKTRQVHFEAMAKLFSFTLEEFYLTFSRAINVFQQSFSEQVQTLKQLTGFQGEINDRLTELGFITHWLSKAPFDMCFEDAILDEGEEITLDIGKRDTFLTDITTVHDTPNKDIKILIERKKRELTKQIEFLRRFKQTLSIDGDMVLLLDDSLCADQLHLQGIPIVHKEEIPSDDPEKLKRIISDRTKK